MSTYDEHLPHVLWVGGPAGAGKTTVARRLARRHGLRWYNCDAQTWQHLDRAVAGAGATLSTPGNATRCSIVNCEDLTGRSDEWDV